MATNKSSGFRNAFSALMGAVMKIAGPGMKQNEQYFYTSLAELRAASGIGGGLTDPLIQMPWVFAGASAIGRNISKVPTLVVRGDRSDPRPQPPVPGHPIQLLLNNPSPGISGARSRWMIAALIAARGEALLAFFDKYGNPTAPWWGGDRTPVRYHILDSTKTQDVCEHGILLGYHERVYGWLPADTVLMIGYPNPKNPHRGINPMEALKIELKSDWNAMMWNATFFDNSADPGGLVIFKRKYTKEQKNAFRDEWMSRHGGPEKRGRFGVLDDEAQYVQFDSKQRDMEFSVQRRNARDTTLAVLGVPPEIVGIVTSANPGSAFQALRWFWANTGTSYLELIEDCFENGIFRKIGDGTHMRFDRSAVPQLQEELEGKSKLAKEFFSIGIPVNQLIKTFALPFDAVEGGNESFVPTSMQTIKNAAKPPKPTAPAGGSPAPDPPAPDAPPAKTNYIQRLKLTIPAQPKAYTDDEKSRQWQLYKSNVLATREYELTKDVKNFLFKKRVEMLETIGNDRAPRGKRTAKADPSSSDDETSFILTEEIIDELLGIQRRWEDDIILLLRDSAALTVPQSIDYLGRQIGGFVGWGSEDDVAQAFIKIFGAAQVRVRGDQSNPGIAENTRQAIKDVLMENVGKPTNIGKLQSEIRKAFNGITPKRALDIARTEVASAANAARYISLVHNKGGILYHEWGTAEDEAVRHDHVAQGTKPNSIVRIGKKFKIVNMLYPHDPQGEAKQVVNCRCFTLPILEEIVVDDAA